MTKQDLEKMIHDFISSKMDYCNGLLTGLPKKTIRHLQIIQNSTVRVLTKTKGPAHITPESKSLHWLPVNHRIDLKVLLLINKSLHGAGPKHKTDMLVQYNPARPLGSLGRGLLIVPRAKTKQGEVAFSHYAAQRWNQLPDDLKMPQPLLFLNPD